MTTKITPVGSAFTFVAADEQGNSVSASPGTGLLPTGATGGFLYVPGMTGAPASSSGPTGYTGTVAHVFDVSNNMPWYLNPVNTFGGSTGATPSWVAGNGQVLIQRVVLGGATGTVTFNNIPQVFNNLRVICYGRTSAVATLQSWGLRFNSDTGNNYDYQEIAVVNTSVSGALSSGTTSLRTGILPGANIPANFVGQTTIDIQNYTNTTFYKSASSISCSFGTSAGDCATKTSTGMWRSTNAITSVIIYPWDGGNFITGTTVYCYGVW